jgi:hypothetical protein
MVTKVHNAYNLGSSIWTLVTTVRLHPHCHPRTFPHRWCHNCEICHNKPRGWSTWLSRVDNNTASLVISHRVKNVSNLQPSLILKPTWFCISADNKWRSLGDRSGLYAGLYPRYWSCEIIRHVTLSSNRTFNTRSLGSLFHIYDVQ